MGGLWQELDDGVMVWAPVTEPDSIFEELKEVPKTHDEASQAGELPETGNRHGHGKHDAVMPYSTYDGRKAMPIAYDTPFPTDSFSSRPLEGSDTEMFSTPTDPETPEDLFFNQLKEFASRVISESPGSTISAPDSASSESLAQLQYDSDRTDFQDTPCPTRKRSPAEGSRYYSSPVKAVKKVNRKLDFGRAAFVRIPVHCKMFAAESPESSSTLDRVPSHRWTPKQREFLCVINRWYHRAPHEFGLIFNTVFGLTLSTRRIKAQYESHIRLYGPQAFFVYSQVLAVPFQDYDRHYEDLRDMIESTARQLGIRLKRLREESFVELGRAAKARSPVTRKEYRRLVRLAKAEAKAAERAPIVEQVSLPAISKLTLGGMAMRNSSLFDEDEILEDAESHSDRPSLAFRVWDQNSGTIYNDGFVANLFAQRRTTIPEPLPPNDIYGLFDVLANDHLSKEGRGGSAFVSVLSSLVQLLVYATKMKAAQSTESNPQIAVIDLSAPCLSNRHKQHYAKDVIRNLRAKGEMYWTRYQGECETLVWACIPDSAILSTLHLSDLEELSDSCRAVAALLRLDLFEDLSSTRSTCKRLKRQNVVLGVNTASAMGFVARVLGLNGFKVKAQHISEFVTTMIDGWYVEVRNSQDAEFMAMIAAAFAQSLNSPNLSTGRVMQNFIDGVNRGVENTARFTRRHRVTYT